MTISLANRFQTYVAHQLPRVLTQLDRDPDSPTFGCFDRHYWHYKIRDFPSTILQQGIFTLEAIRQGWVALPSTETIDQWCVGAVNALARQVDRQGRVDEYYPFEAGYPPAAFGLYAAGRVLLDWQQHAPHLLPQVHQAPLRRLAHHLAQRVEQGATNQQAAGLAGLALAARAGLLPHQAERIAALATQMFQAQHPEGWFNEYGGPDFGYLTVTLDALVDYYDATGDDRAIAASDRAIHFLAQLVGSDGRLPSTLNSRNTDYVVPYGLVRAAQRNPTAAWLVATLFRDLDGPTHFLWSTDDRYLCHYIFASIVRSLPYLETLRSAQPPDLPKTTWLAGCGYWIFRPPQATWTAFVAARKGGLVRIHRQTEPPVLDHGWRIVKNGDIWTTNWWSADWQIQYDGDRLHLSGQCQQTQFHTPSPWKNGVLRLLAWGLRQRLIPLLKQVMIFRSGQQTGPLYERTLTIDERGMHLHDRFAPHPGARAIASPRQNLRHVASADSFHREELRAPLNDPGTALALDTAQVIHTQWPPADQPPTEGMRIE